ncbi:MAG: YceD family protein [Paracoccaceae bacterium]
MSSPKSSPNASPKSSAASSGKAAASSAPLRVSALKSSHPTRFNVAPSSADMAALAKDLGLSGLRKLSFQGEVQADGKRDWLLKGRLGATVTQPCVVTLEPVSTRIDTDVARRFSPDFDAALVGDTDEEEGIEMPDDETLEPLGDVIDPAAVMVEALALALPLYPRKDGAHLGEAVYTAEGAEPLTEEKAKPFAGLAALKARMEGGEET